MSLKVREIEQRLKTMGEQGLRFVILEMAEEIKQLEKTCIEVSRQVDQMATLMGQFVAVAGEMKKAHQRVLRMIPREDLPPTRGEPN